MDEPANPNRPSLVPAAGLTRAYNRLKQLDANHPVVIIQAPLGPESDLERYRPALDVTGADIYPVSYPPGTHSDLPNKDISTAATFGTISSLSSDPRTMQLAIRFAF